MVLPPAACDIHDEEMPLRSAPAPAALTAPTSLALLNGRTPELHDILEIAFAGVGCSSGMQVRDRAVRGIDLHLAHLRDASDELFGEHVEDEEIRRQLRAALRSAPADVWATVAISSRDEAQPRRGYLDVLIHISDPVAPAVEPLSLEPVHHQRHLPWVDAASEVPGAFLRRRARSRGYDDAVLQDDVGRLIAATSGNLTFWDGTTVAWPQADTFPGVTMQILTRQLAALGVAQQTKPVHRNQVNPQLAGVIMNSNSPGIPISRIGARRLKGGGDFARLLQDAYEREPFERV